MLCANCKKNQATKSYESMKKGTPTTEYFCLDCYDKLFLAPQSQGEKGTVCPYCGTTAETLKKRQLVGCAKCYQTLGAVTGAMVKKMQGEQWHDGKRPVGGQSESVARRCGELKLLIDKFNAEKNFTMSRTYTERLMRLQAGMEEEYVWQKRRRLLKR
jgi:protein-arginine kinase activator protein McsA